MKTEERTGSVYFRATVDGVKMVIAEHGGDKESMSITLSLQHAVHCVQRLREETTEYKRLVRRAERIAAREAAKVANLAPHPSDSTPQSEPPSPTPAD